VTERKEGVSEVEARASFPFLSIVTICKQNAAGLQRTLESVADQSERDFELIVVDGGSTDDTAAVVAGFDEIVTHFTSEPDRGIAHAFNNGTAAARGRLVNYLNAGDHYADASVLKHVREVWEKTRFVWAFGLPVRVNEYGDRFPPLAIQLRPYTFGAFARGAMAISHQATFFDTAIVRSVGGYDEAFQFQAMDYDLMLRIGKRHEPVPIGRKLVVYDLTGVSARSNLSGLLAKHRARAAVLELSAPARAVDRVRILLHYCAGRARNRGKRALLSLPAGRKLLRARGLLE
jgi:glycosyltransferase involved in cell wall biosynthesis